VVSRYVGDTSTRIIKTYVSLDWFMHTRVMYHALHVSGMSNSYVIQDLALPIDGAEDFLNWIDKDLEIYPLWLCPLSQRPTGVMSPRVPVPNQAEQDSDSSTLEVQKPEVMLNIGVWGAGPRDREKFIAIDSVQDDKPIFATLLLGQGIDDSNVG